jgi:hypothetical protein
VPGTHHPGAFRHLDRGGPLSNPRTRPKTAIPGRSATPNRSGCGALLPSREPLNATVESATRRQNGQGTA